VTGADRAIRWAAALAVATVAAIAAVISYSHAYQLVVTYGEAGATARALPLTVDGLIVTCSLVLLDAARRRQQGPALAWWLLGCGILATLGANIAHGVAHGVVGAVIAGWPALVAVGSFEMLARLIRGGRATPAEKVNTQVTGASLPADLPEAFTAESTTPAALGTRHGVAEIDQQPGDLPALETRAAGTDLAALETGNGITDPVLASARETFAETLSAGSVPSVRSIRRELKVGHPRAVRVRAALAGG
jgi:hypothetical protein